MDARNFIRDLEVMRKEALTRLETARADLDAIDRVLAVRQSTLPAPEPASPEDVRNAVVDVLIRGGEPMHRKNIFEELTDMGVHVNGKDPVATLGTVLSRYSKDFHPHGQGIWGLKLGKTPEFTDSTPEGASQDWQ